MRTKQLRTKPCVDCGKLFEYKQVNKLRCFECQKIRHRQLHRITERVRSKTERYKERKRLANKRLKERKAKGEVIKRGGIDVPLSKSAIDELLRIGVGDAISNEELLLVGYTTDDIPILRKMYPDSMYPLRSSEESYCGCSLFSGELIRSFRKCIAL